MGLQHSKQLVKDGFGEVDKMDTSKFIWKYIDEN